MNKILILTLVGLSLVSCGDNTANKPVAPDNTGINVRDRNEQALTPGNQFEDKADRTITQQIRQMIVKDKDLSFNAHNIKIVSANGVVTLRGPVNSEAEKANIDAKVKQVSGITSVKNELEVVPNKNVNK